MHSGSSSPLSGQPVYHGAPRTPAHVPRRSAHRIGPIGPIGPMEPGGRLPPIRPIGPIAVGTGLPAGASPSTYSTQSLRSSWATARGSHSPARRSQFVARSLQLAAWALHPASSIQHPASSIQYPASVFIRVHLRFHPLPSLLPLRDAPCLPFVPIRVDSWPPLLVFSAASALLRSLCERVLASPICVHPRSSVVALSCRSPAPRAAKAASSRRSPYPPPRWVTGRRRAARREPRRPLPSAFARGFGGQVRGPVLLPPRSPW